MTMKAQTVMRLSCIQSRTGYR